MGLTIIGPFAGRVFSRIVSDQTYYKWSDIIWSPDSSKIAFLREATGFGFSEETLFLINIDKNIVEKVALEDAPNWFGLIEEPIQTNQIESTSPSGEYTAIVRLEAYLSFQNGYENDRTPEILLRKQTTAQEVRLFPLIKLEALGCPTIVLENRIAEVTATFSSSPVNATDIDIPITLLEQPYNYYDGTVLEPIESLSDSTQWLSLAPGEEAEISWELAQVSGGLSVDQPNYNQYFQIQSRTADSPNIVYSDCQITIVPDSIIRNATLWFTAGIFFALLFLIITRNDGWTTGTMVSTLRIIILTIALINAVGLFLMRNLFFQ